MIPIQQIFDPPSTTDLGGAWWVTVRLAAAAILGAVIAGLYRHSRHPSERRRGFDQTLVLLAPLIAMVTMAVGNNVAAAFTLVGTLAIVRFRTAVRDARDTVYVIFSVAMGMAMANLNLVVAIAGILVIGLVVLIIRRLEGSDRPSAPGELRLIISPPTADLSPHLAVLRQFAVDYSIARSAIDGGIGQTKVWLTVRGVDTAQTPQLLVDLLAIDDVLHADYSAPTE